MIDDVHHELIILVLFFFFHHQICSSSFTFSCEVISSFQSSSSSSLTPLRSSILITSLQDRPRRTSQRASERPSTGPQPQATISTASPLSVYSSLPDSINPRTLHTPATPHPSSNPGFRSSSDLGQASTSGQPTLSHRPSPSSTWHASKHQHLLLSTQLDAWKAYLPIRVRHS